MSEKQVLRNNEFKFNKNFGQNFIFDKNLLNAIVKDSGITKDEEVLEIGPGAGTLTRAIAENCKKVISYEIDTNLKPILEENLKGLTNSQIVFKDALKEDLKNIESNFDNEYHVIANLPYYITTPLIFKFVGKTDKVKTLCVMVQKEVGERFIAKQKDDNYGAISVILDFYGDVKILRQVNRKMFTPVPNVDSCIIQITLKKNKFDVDCELFEEIVKSAFANRRKTLANNLSVTFKKSKQNIFAFLEGLGFNPQVRGDALSTLDFVTIAKNFDKLV